MRKLRLARWNFWAKSHHRESEVVESTSSENHPRDRSRAEFLRKAASGLAAAVGGGTALAIGGSKVVKAANCDPVLLGMSGDPCPNGPCSGPPPNLAECATEVQYDGPPNPTLGVVFLAQADNKYTPSAAANPAALAGWTSLNPDIPNGVYGYTERPNGSGVVGWGNAANGTSNGVRGQTFGANGVGGAFIGPNRAPLNLQPVMVNQPPATGQGGDLYVTVNVDGACTLWFHTGIGGWKICCQ